MLIFLRWDRSLVVLWSKQIVRLRLCCLARLARFREMVLDVKPKKYAVLFMLFTLSGCWCICPGSVVANVRLDVQTRIEVLSDLRMLAKVCEVDA